MLEFVRHNLLFMLAAAVGMFSIAYFLFKIFFKIIGDLESYCVGRRGWTAFIPLVFAVVFLAGGAIILFSFFIALALA